MVWTCWVAMEATTERPKRNGVMRRARLANPRCLPRALRTSASRTAWNLLAMLVDCWRSIRLSFHASKGFGGLDGSCQKSREFQEVRSSRPVVDSLSPYLCDKHTVGKQHTQKIERKHTTLRARIKRLVRKTICFSKSIQMHDLVIGLFINRFAYGRAILISDQLIWNITCNKLQMQSSHRGPHRLLQN